MRTAPWEDGHGKGTLHTGTSEPPRGRGDRPKCNVDTWPRQQETRQLGESSGGGLPWEGRRASQSRSFPEPTRAPGAAAYVGRNALFLH